VFGNFSIFDAKEVVDPCGYAAERSFRDDEYKISFAKYFVNTLVNNSLPLCRESLQTCDQASPAMQ